MKNKIIYSILFVSIFLLSTATMVQPAHGYTFGVPDQAKGMEGEGEIKIYDDDEWEKHLGKDGDEPDDIWDGDSDVVGAKSKGKVKDWEEDEDLIHFFWDFVLETDLDLTHPVTGELDPTVSKYKDAINFVNNAVAGDMADLLGLVSSIADSVRGEPGVTNATAEALRDAAGAAYAQFLAGTVKEAEAKVLYDKKVDGTILTQDSWDFYENADYPSKPDNKDTEAPFMADPRDLRDSYDLLFALKTNIYRDLDRYTVIGSNLFGLVYMSLNISDPMTIAIIDATLTGYAAAVLGMVMDLYTALGTPAQGPGIIHDAFEELIPKRAGYLYMALEGGLPCYVPTGDFLAKMIDEFDIDDENIETGHPAMEGMIPFTCDVKVEGMVATMKFEFDDYLDPADTVIDKDLLVAEKDPDELKDWKVVFTYSEYGSQSKIQYMDGDDIFFEKGGVDQIPGFEITIILGASAISIMGLIYVIMKKRKR